MNESGQVDEGFRITGRFNVMLLKEKIMSEHLHMDRRRLLQSAFALVGSSVALSACDFSTLVSRGSFSFSHQQRALLSAIADTLVPKTDTGGAIEAGVPQAFEGLLSNWAKPQTKRLLLAAIDNIEVQTQKAKGKGFADLTATDKTAWLTEIDAEGLKMNPVAPKLTGLYAILAGPAYMNPGYAKLKSLLVTLYYTSELALTEEMPYQHTPGKFQPSIPVTTNTRPSSTSAF